MDPKVRIDQKFVKGTFSWKSRISSIRKGRTFLYSTQVNKHFLFYFSKVVLERQLRSVQWLPIRPHTKTVDTPPSESTVGAVSPLRPYPDPSCQARTVVQFRGRQEGHSSPRAGHSTLVTSPWPLRLDTHHWAYLSIVTVVELYLGGASIGRTDVWGLTIKVVEK